MGLRPALSYCMVRIFIFQRWTDIGLKCQLMRSWTTWESETWWLSVCEVLWSTGGMASRCLGLVIQYRVQDLQDRARRGWRIKRGGSRVLSRLGWRTTFKFHHGKKYDIGGKMWRPCRQFKNPNFFESPAHVSFRGSNFYRWWFQVSFYFHPPSLGRWSNLTCAYFSNGLVQNHQLDRPICCDYLGSDPMGCITISHRHLGEYVSLKKKNITPRSPRLLKS